MQTQINKSCESIDKSSKCTGTATTNSNLDMQPRPRIENTVMKPLKPNRVRQLNVKKFNA